MNIAWLLGEESQVRHSESDGYLLLECPSLDVRLICPDELEQQTRTDVGVHATARTHRIHVSEAAR